MTERQIVKTLEKAGWQMESKVKDTGGLKRNSVFEVTITRFGSSFTFEFTKGCGLRKWKPRAQHVASWGPGCEYWATYCKPGRQVQAMPSDLKRPEDCKLELQSRQQEIFDAFEKLTEPEPVTLDEALYSILSDANCVRYGQTFEEFCGELGWDTDSRKAEKSYNVCRDMWSALVRFDANFDELEKMFENY